MIPDAIALASFGEEHLDAAHRLSREAGWPHRREDWAMGLSLGQGVVALDDGAVVGTAMTTPFGTGATVSVVIVDAGLRGHGLGRRLMNAAVDTCGAREARLVATKDGLPLYRKLGFRETHEIRQHQGIVLSAEDAPDAGVEWAADGDLPAICALDAAATGMDRAALLRLIGTEGRFAILRRGGQVTGFGALRFFGRGEVAGPVVAASEAEARTVLRFLLGSRAGAFVRVDTAAFATLGPWLAARGVAEVAGGIAMRREAVPPAAATAAPDFQTFALVSQALG